VVKLRRRGGCLVARQSGEAVTLAKQHPHRSGENWSAEVMLSWKSPKIRWPIAAEATSGTPRVTARARSPHRRGSPPARSPPAVRGASALIVRDLGLIALERQ
jgi:hypothetical protein